MAVQDVELADLFQGDRREHAFWKVNDFFPQSFGHALAPARGRIRRDIHHVFFQAVIDGIGVQVIGTDDHSSVEGLFQKSGQSLSIALIA